MLVDLEVALSDDVISILKAGDRVLVCASLIALSDPKRLEWTQPHQSHRAPVMPITASAGQLTTFGQSVLEHHGVPTVDAHLLADSMVAAELWGHSSHGMLRLPWYVERLRSGAMRAVTQGVLAQDNGAVAVIDGQDGIGQVLTMQAVHAGVARAKRFGVSAVAVRNSNHFGTAAYFTRESAKQGCVAFLSTNASPAMAPWGGKAKAIGTNPWSIAAPAGRHG